MPSIKEMKAAIARAGLATADLLERPDVEARYGEALARLEEADRLRGTPAGTPSPTKKARTPAAEGSTPPVATAKTSPPPDASIQPVAHKLSHILPSGLLRLAQTSKAWRDAARDAGVVCVVTKMSSNNMDFCSHEGELYGEFYEDRAASPDGPRFRLELGYIVDPSDTEPQELEGEEGDDHQYYEAVDVEMSACPLLVECSGVVNDAVMKVRRRVRLSDATFSARELSRAGFSIGHLPKALDVLPLPLVRAIAGKIVGLNETKNTCDIDCYYHLVGARPPWWDDEPPKRGWGLRRPGVREPIETIAKHLCVIKFAAPVKRKAKKQSFWEAAAARAQSGAPDSDGPIDITGWAD